jgi:hypothetical protein
MLRDGMDTADWPARSSPALHGKQEPRGAPCSSGVHDNGRMWFSAMLQVAVSVGSSRPVSIERTVIVFEGDEDWTAATNKALAIGATKEDQYESADGQIVRRRLIAIETLDMLGDTIEDGREIYFESVDAREFDVPTVAPQNRAPGQSGV